MSGFSCKKKAETVKVIFYHQGKESVVNSEQSGFSDLIKTAEDLLITADDMLKLEVDPELIKAIKKKDSAIEIIFPKPIELTSNYDRQSIHPDRILIPLSGEFVGEEENPAAVIFHGYPSYSSGPFTNINGIKELKEILQAMEIQ